MQYLYFLLMVAGIILLIIGVKTIPRLVNTKLLYEMPCVDKEGVFSCRRECMEYGLAENYLANPL